MCIRDRASSRFTSSSWALAQPLPRARICATVVVYVKSGLPSTVQWMHTSTARHATFKRNQAVRLQVTEGILYQLLPTLITSAESKVREQGNATPCGPYVEVASATLAASCILNVPPGFIEFLLCTPWHQMSVIQAGSDLESLLGVVNITTEQRTEAVNKPLPDYLVPVLTSFIYQDCYLSSLPPVLVLTHDERGNKLPAPEAPAAAGSEEPAVHTSVWTPVSRRVRPPKPLHVELACA